jgi:hypothetical protein
MGWEDLLVTGANLDILDLYKDTLLNAFLINHSLRGQVAAGDE